MSIPIPSSLLHSWTCLPFSWLPFPSSSSRLVPPTSRLGDEGCQSITRDLIHCMHMLNALIVGFEYSSCTVNLHPHHSPLTGIHIHPYRGAPDLSGITAPPPPLAPPTPSMVAPAPPTQPVTAATDSPSPSQRGVWHCL